MIYTIKKSNMKRIILITILLGITMTATANQPLITHKLHNNFDISTYYQQLDSVQNRVLPLTEEKELLRQLSEFELGRFLLDNKGLNGYWTAYIILYGPKLTNLPELEYWLLHRSPAIKATQERFMIFRQQLQARIHDNMKIASIPCGLMDDLLGLENTDNIALVGIDLDQQSLKEAAKNAKKYNRNNVEFRHEDAWNLSTTNEFDIIVSNGLNIYQPDNKKVIELYRQFYNALKPGSILITSFLTSPPALSKDSTWKNYNQDDALKQKAIFSDIIQTRWQSFRTEAETKNQLEHAGFKIEEVIYDSQGMFPTIIARK